MIAGERKQSCLGDISHRPVVASSYLVKSDPIAVSKEGRNAAIDKLRSKRIAAASRDERRSLEPMSNAQHDESCSSIDEKFNGEYTFDESPMGKFFNSSYSVKLYLPFNRNVGRTRTRSEEEISRGYYITTTPLD